MRTRQGRVLGQLWSARPRSYQEVPSFGWFGRDPLELSGKPSKRRCIDIGVVEKGIYKGSNKSCLGNIYIYIMHDLPSAYMDMVSNGDL